MPRKLFYELFLMVGVVLCGGGGIWLLVQYVTSRTRGYGVIGGGLIVFAAVSAGMLAWSFHKHKDDGNFKIGE